MCETSVSAAAGVGQIHVARHCLHCHSEQKWCLVFGLFQSHFGPSAQTGPIVMVQAGASIWPRTFPIWRAMSQCEHACVRQSFIPWRHEVECIMMSPFCSSGVPIQFQPFWALFCFKLIFFICFLTESGSDSMG